MAEKQPPAAAGTKKSKGALTNEDVLMTHVAPCLSYMDLFSLVKTTKEMRSRLTHEHSLTAVLLNADDKFGKNAKATIRNVMDLYEKGKIHKPSPMRLLRLANGKRCEMGPPCDTPEARKVVKTRPDWGLFCCWPHTVGGSAEISLSKKSLKTWGATVGDPRTCQHSMSNKTFLWKKPMTAADGEKIGPITTATSPHDGSTPDPTLVQLFQRLDREGRERMSAAAAVKADARQKKKASKDQKIAAIDATVKRLAGEVQGVAGCRALVEQLDPLYLAPSKASPAKLRAIVDDVRDAYAAADAALGDFSFLDESNLRDAVLKKALTMRGYPEPVAEFAPADFLRYASREVLDLAAAGRLREAMVLRLYNQPVVCDARRMSRQLASIKYTRRASPKRLKQAFIELMGRPPADDRRNIAQGAWQHAVEAPAEPALVDPLVRANSPEALEAVVNAARDMYDRALADARELGQRIDAARNLDAGAGEAFLLKYSHLRYGFFVSGIGSDWTYARILEYYDQQNAGPGGQISRGSAASPLGFWAGDA
ncbi:unnamed protein product [Pelagomonas calceolata]|uniref:Uncharacterized protein n=1 Tax=Pelagomonas calceolata TaxID=35677 RepID=A0A7S4A8A0_9STRA|nr:unnamed protein product [Pelagomonas calceolata]|mmetsp:Transcript_6737/g.19935  ORF Transcript_6737/g.19935 Transcript_6737/m.19935 type:complete len:539 (-) Transcript_6737:35-1651(-)